MRGAASLIYMPFEQRGLFVVSPSSQADTPEVPTNGLITLRDLGFPDNRRRFTLTEVAARLCVDPAEPEKRRAAELAMLRTLERECERGKLRAYRVGRPAYVTREALAAYLLAGNTLVGEN